MTLRTRIVDAIIARAKCDPYFPIDGYMERYWLLRPRKWLPISIRVHKILRSDDDRHLHDHPWRWASWILRGRYCEVTPALNPNIVPPTGRYRRSYVTDLAGGTCEYRWYGEGSFRARRPTDRHRLIVDAGESVWTLFIMGPRVQEWGFYTPAGKVPWHQYLTVEEAAVQRREYQRLENTA